ncbi:putative bacteriophage protein [Serratia sp. DD3]|uniref:putative bacteriophage protein n=1 Tax=Serratia sp. DD3 TaxID=1410619 RepID=UPI0003C50B96|nr:putative bacteriophage protein [Serratia sp. DD3]KEY56938.1 phage-related minor tail protein [Serratia sp. DD3]
MSNAKTMTNPQVLGDSASEMKLSTRLAGMASSLLNVASTLAETTGKVVTFTTQVAEEFDKVYFSAKRVGSSASGILALGYAAEQTGADSADALNSLNSLAGFMENNPKAEQILNGIGVKTRDGKGQQRDNQAILMDLGDRMAQMPAGQASSLAQQIGVDQHALQSMRQPMEEYSQMLAVTGLNAEKAAQQSNAYMTSVRRLSTLSDMVSNKIGSEIAGGLSGPLNQLFERIMSDGPRLETFINGVGRAAAWVGEKLGKLAYYAFVGISEVIKWWDSLDSSSQTVIGVFGAILTAWRVLGSAFMTSPLGIILAVATALMALYDDFQTWKAGGESLFDWGPIVQAFEYVREAIGSLGADFGELWGKITQLGSAIGDAAKQWLDIDTSSFGEEISQLGTIIGDTAKKWFDFITIDFSKFDGKRLFDQIIESVRSSIKFVGALVDALRKLISGDITGAGESLNEARKIAIESPAGQGVKSLYFAANDKVNEYLPKWMGGSAKKLPDNWSLPNLLGFISPDSPIADKILMSDPQRMINSLPPTTSNYSPTLYSPAMGLSGNVAKGGNTLNQNTVITINGAVEPTLTGMAVLDGQFNLNARLYEQLTTDEGYC